MDRYRELIDKIKSVPPVARLLQRPVLFKIATNTGWLFLDKMIKLVVGLFVGAWVTRYLGPARYGEYNYVVAFVSIFAPLSGLGLANIVIRELVSHPDKKNELLGTSVAMQIIASVFSYGLAIFVAILLSPNLDRFIVYVAILSGMLIIQIWNGNIAIWFQSQVQTKFNVWSRILAILIVSVIRIGLILNQAPLVAFIWALMIEVALSSIAITYFYLKEAGRLSSWKINLGLVQNLLKDSWPLVISGIASIMYKRIDRIMLGDLIGDTELGIYSAAVQLSELWFFIPTAIGASLFPIIIRSMLDPSNDEFENRMQLFFDLLSLISFIIIIVTVIIAPWLVVVLFGKEYIGSGEILQVHVWTLLFLSIGVGQNQWFVAKNIVKYSMISTIIGAIVNICLNLWLIPIYGGIGAAWASVTSFALIVFLIPIFSKELRDLSKFQLRALVAPLRILSISLSIKKVIQKQ